MDPSDVAERRDGIHLILHRGFVKLNFITLRFSASACLSRSRLCLEVSRPMDVQDLTNRIGPYILIRRIARGGMGEIFLARQNLPRGYERPIVVKRILPHLSDDEKFVEMFLREAHTASRLQHENIVQIYQVGRDASQYFIAMEYVEGKDLRSVLVRAAENDVNIPHEVASYVVACVCRGLQYAHKKVGAGGEALNIVHRDVSPQNILVSYEGGIRLIDFGISKATGCRGLTHPGTFKGKLAYMSPEQVRGEPVDHRSDIFSAGVVLYELLTGGPLFSAPTDYQILEQLRTFSLKERVRAKESAIAGPLQTVLERALQNRREDRYSVIRDMEMDLDRFLQERHARNGASSLTLVLNRLFAEEMARESEELVRTRTIALSTEAAETCPADEGKTPSRVDPPMEIAEDKRILKHKLVILILVLVIVFEMFIFIWRDFQWRKRDRVIAFPATSTRPPAGAEY